MFSVVLSGNKVVVDVSKNPYLRVGAYLTVLTDWYQLN